MLVLWLLAQAPAGGAAADGRASQLGPAARADAVAPRPAEGAAPGPTVRLQRGPYGRPQGDSQAVELRGRQVPGRAPRADSRPPQGLVGQEIADAREDGLVEQAGLDRRAAALHAGAEDVARDRGGIRSEARAVAVEHRAAQAAFVPQGDAGAVGEAEG